jgi:type IV secretion system protein VirB5
MLGRAPSSNGTCAPSTHAEVAYPPESAPTNHAAAVAALPTAAPPHLRGRAEFDSVFGDLARGKRNWQLVAFGALGVSGLLAGGLVTLATQSRITPYVVEVDRLGRAQAFGPAERLRLTDQRVVTSQLAAFVRDVRAVVGDAAVQADLVRRAYAYADQGAASFLNVYFTDTANDPRLLGREHTRLVEITSVLPVPGPPMPGVPASGARDQEAARLPATWKVSWTETTIPRGLGGAPVVSAWEGYLTTRLAPPADAERITLNPLGLYVTSVTWTRLSVREAAPASAPGWGAPGAGMNQPDTTPAQQEGAR